MAIATTKAKFVKEGKTLDYTIAAGGTAVKEGDFKVVNDLCCLALWDIDAGTTGTLKILDRGEVVTVTTDEAIGATNAGVKIYLTSAGLVTKTATDNTFLGTTKAAVAATDLSFEVICA